ncbi:hypothetical protein FHS95_002843 [Sphingomonas naasensis]|uniref:RHS repeat protein n=1 Tax=Sphingomonas naasensis TaxID=1344951 RepID=A0A4S1WCA9_9SPHN|nr:hypothetical protein [Sphingomonas naasensis]NIJ21140.1 hypothetical protein [Sphingomonas naasensis]TGX38276.1 hypothetical protein E5A74_18820 [Sphingomonas naasensis]
MKQLKKSLALACAASALYGAGAASAQDIVPPKVYTMTPTGVSLADGSFTFTDTDLVIGTLRLERFHLGGQRDPNNPFFGPRMSHNYDIYVAPNQKTNCDINCTTFKKPIVHMGTSASGTFYETMPPNSVLQHSTDDSYAGELVRDGSGAYVYTDRDGNVYTFSTTVGVAGSSSLSKRVANIVFANGRRQDFAYNGSGQLKAVVDSSGYAIVFDYAANGNVGVACGYNLADTYVSVSSTCAGAALKVSYGYSADTPAKLISVTDPDNNVTTYSYTGKEIACVTPPGYTTCKVSNAYGYSPNVWQVTQQTLADNAVWKYSYSGDYSKPRDPEAYAEIEPWTQANVTDPALKTSYYTFVATSPFTAVDANGQTTNYRYQGGWDYQTSPAYSQNHGSALVEVTLPEGNKYLAAYGGPRRSVTEERLRAKPGSGLADIVKQYGYVADCTTAPNTPQNCAKPIWTKDAKLNQTDYTYAANGLLLTAMQPAPTTGAARPLKIFTYVQKYAWVKNSGGGLSPSAAPMWVPQTEAICQTAAGSSTPVCDGAAVQTVTTYEYGPDGTANNLRVRGMVVSSGGTSLRTCYGYDWRGNKISQTSPRAGLSVCQ